MEVIYLIFVFTWRSGSAGVAAFAEKVPQASIEQCEETALHFGSYIARSSSNASPGSRRGRAHQSQLRNL